MNEFKLVNAHPHHAHQPPNFTKMCLDKVQIGDVILVHPGVFVPQYLDENTVEGLVILVTDEKSFYDPDEDQKKIVFLFFDGQPNCGWTKGTNKRLAFIRRESST